MTLEDEELDVPVQLIAHPSLTLKSTACLGVHVEQFPFEDRVA